MMITHNKYNTLIINRYSFSVVELLYYTKSGGGEKI
jgi:hypothetical protein